MEKKGHQLYRRPYMMGKARGKEDEEVEDNRVGLHRRRRLYYSSITEQTSTGSIDLFQNISFSRVMESTACYTFTQLKK